MASTRCLALAVVIVAFPFDAAAAPVWVGDFEGGDLSQWDSTLNGEVNGVDYITVVGDTVVQGSSAARIELRDDAIWPGNMLRRVELHHGPDPGRTAEGQTTWFAWSFYLDAPLPDDPGTTIGYWESNASYQQVMAFNTSGDTIRFITQRPSYQEHWVGDGLFTAGEWHRIAMRVLWSTDDGTGEVEVWFDGAQVLPTVTVQTLADGNDHFTQVGLLRGNQDFDDVPVIYIDDAVEGDSIEDVHPELEPPSGTDSSSGTTDAPSDSSGGDDSTGGATADESTGTTASTATATDATASATTSSTATATSATAGSDDTTGNVLGEDDGESGCGCTSGNATGRLAFLVLPALLLRRRRSFRHAP